MVNLLVLAMGEENKEQLPTPPVTVSQTLLVSFGALTGGFAIGVLYQFRKQNRKFDLRRYDFMLATKALLAGTALCLGTFSVIGSIFVYTTGVTSFQGLRFYFESLAKGKRIDGPSEEEMNYKNATQGMSISEEWDYLYSKYIAFEVEKSNEESDHPIVIDESRIHEKVSEKELLEWEQKNQKEK
jgi:hypothetical protein